MIIVIYCNQFIFQLNTCPTPHQSTRTECTEVQILIIVIIIIIIMTTIVLMSTVIVQILIIIIIMITTIVLMATTMVMMFVIFLVMMTSTLNPNLRIITLDTFEFRRLDINYLSSYQNQSKCVSFLSKSIEMC